MMKHKLYIAASLLSFCLLGQKAPLQQLKYEMDLSLKDNIVQGSQTIHYTHNGEKPIDTIYFNLWANAFGDKASPYANQQLRLRSIEFQYAEESEMGGFISINIDNYKLQYRDELKGVAFVILPVPLQKGQHLDLNLEYSLKLPRLYDRIGHRNEHTYLTNFYPEVAAYDHLGWHTMPYLAMGEFFHAKSDFHVALTLDAAKTPISGATILDKGNNSWQLVQENVSNLAIFLNDHSESKQTYKGLNNAIEILIYADPKNEVWQQSKRLTEEIIFYYEKLLGPFPYQKLAIVQGHPSLESGMEYPGSIVINDVSNIKSLEYYLAHEIAHQYFYGALSSNERDEAYLDEGLSTWLERKYTFQKYGEEYYSSLIPSWFNKSEEVPILNKIHMFQMDRDYDQALNTKIENMSSLNYGLNFYPVAAHLWRYVEQYIGEEKWSELLKSYISKNRNSIFYGEEFLNYISEETGKNVLWVMEIIRGNLPKYKVIHKTQADFTLTNDGSPAPLFIEWRKNGQKIYDEWILGFTGEKKIEQKSDNVKFDPEYFTMNTSLSNQVLHKSIIPPIKFHFPFGINDFKKCNIHITPLLGYNYNDGLMLGTAFYNSTFPAKNTKFMIAPLYGLDSKKISGHAWLRHNIMTTNSSIFRKVEISTGLKSFHYFTNDIIGYKLRYTKIDPSIFFHFRSSPTSTHYHKAGIKWIYFDEQYSKFDQNPAYPTIINNKNSVFRFRYEHFDVNVLSPNDTWIETDFMKYNAFSGDEHFLKITAARKSAWHYRKDKNIHMRLWASAFILNTQREANTYSNELARGSIALIHQGNNDYTYDEYFFNRTNQTGALSNQISEKGGGFKTPLNSAYDIGESNDWAASVNLAVDIPIRGKILKPVQFYFDTGIFRQGGKNNLVYSGGIALNFLDGVFKMYLPLINHKSISDIYRQENPSLFSRVSFSIDLVRYNPWDIIDDFNF